MNEPKIVTCKILGVNIAVTDMTSTVAYIEQNIESLRGEYICVSNVHTTITAYADEQYLNVQNSAKIALPDGRPLSLACKRRGYSTAERVTGPDLMGNMFERENGIRHFFYGDKQTTLDILKQKLLSRYPAIRIAGMISPPFRDLTKEEDDEMIRRINEAKPDIVWVGLGAPKQERWMYEHRGKINAVMIGVGAGFSYHADLIKRAPMWMQKMSLEWLYRLLQDPVRLAKRYLTTNVKYMWLISRENRKFLKNIKH